MQSNKPKKKKKSYKTKNHMLSYYIESPNLKVYLKNM